MISVLYVDDEPELLEIAKIFLEQGGEFRVGTATAAGEALEKGNIPSYDAVISDYMMPGMDGIAFLKAVREQYGDIPFILFTGRGREEVVIAAINNGADFYLQKGGDPASQFAELAHKIRQAVARRRAELRRIESEKRLADIINFLPDATFAIDRTGTVIAWNHAIEEMTGIPASAMVGKGNYEYAIPFYGTRRKILIDLIFEPDDIIAEHYAHIVREKDTLIADTSLPRPRGRAATLMGKAGPLYDRRGEIAGAIESIRDITAIKEAEAGLLHAKKDWETIFRAIGHPAFVLDPENRILDANDATVRAMGMSVAELKGRHCFELFHAPGTTGPPRTCPCAKLKGTGQSETEEMEVEGLGGWYSVTCTPVFDEDGRLEKVIHIAMDVTARRRAEDDLRKAYEQITASEEELKGQYEELVAGERRIRESEEKFRTLFNNATDAIYLHELLPDGSPGRFTEVNDVMCSRLGYTRDELLAMTVRDIVSEAHRQKMPDIRGRITSTGCHTFEAEHRRKDGSVFPVEVNVRRFTLHGKGIVLAIARDITGLRQSEKELRKAYEQITASEEELREQYDELAAAQQKLVESREQLAEIADTIPGVIYQFYARPDGTMGFYYISSSAREIFGIEADTSQSLSQLIERVDPRDRDAFMDSIQRTVASASPWDFEGRFIRPDGEVIWFQGTSHPVKRPSELVYYGMLLDITRRKRAEEELSRSEERYRMLVETAEEGIWIVSEDFLSLFTNRKMQEIFGYSSKEMAGRPVWDFVPPEDVESMKQELFQRLRGIPGRYERRWIRKDGKIIWCLTSATPLFSPDGKFAGSFGMFTDITARREMEESLRESEAKYRTLVDNVQDVIYRSDRDGNLIMASPSILTLLGYSSLDEVLGKNIADQFWMEPSRRQEFLDALREKGSIAGYEIVLKKKDGSPVIISASSHFYYQNDGTVAGIEGVFHDITAMRRAEQEARLLASLNDLSPASIVVHTPEGEILYANQRTFDLHGWTRDEFMAKNLHEIDVPASEKLINRRVDQLRKTGEASFDVEHFRKDGSTIPLSVTAKIMQWRGREVVLSIAIDISERKRADEALRQANIVVENSPVVLFRWKAAEGWPVVYVSQNVSWFGYTPEELLSGAVPYSSLVYPADLARVAGEVERYTAEGTDRFLQEYRIVTRSGDIRWVDDRTVIERDQDGRVTHYQGIILDITDRKRAEEALEKRIVALSQPLEGAEIAFEDLFSIGEIQRLQDEFAKATGVAMLLTRPDGTPITKPSNFCRLCSSIVRSTPAGRERCYRSDAILGELHEGGPFIHVCYSAGLWGAGTSIVLGGRHIANWLIGQVRNEAQTEGQMRAYAREIGVDEEEFIRAFLDVPMMSTARFEAVAWSLYLLADQLSRSAYQNVQQARFITGRRRAEEALHQSEEQYRRILENMQDAYIRTDGDGIVRMVNPSAARMYRFGSVDEMIGIPAASLYHHSGQRDEMLHKLGEAGGVTDFIGEARRKDGTTFWASLNVQFIRDEKGRVQGTEGFVRDISERKAMEHTLQEVNRKLSLLSSITRHDITNRIATISGFAKAARMANPGPSILGYLDKIEAARSDIARQIAFMKTYQELGMHAPGWQNIGTLVARQKAEGIRISCDCDAEIVADPMLEKVIHNLIDNAVRHGERVTEIRLSCAPGPGGLVIAIEDNGVGIPADLKETIFDRGVGKHTGYGLFLAREILAITGITIRETGTPGDGARFEITVPEDRWRRAGKGS